MRAAAAAAQKLPPRRVEVAEMLRLDRVVVKMVMVAPLVGCPPMRLADPAAAKTEVVAAAAVAVASYAQWRMLQWGVAEVVAAAVTAAVESCQVLV